MLLINWNCSFKERENTDSRSEIKLFVRTIYIAHLFLLWSLGPDIMVYIECYTATKKLMAILVNAMYNSTVKF